MTEEPELNIVSNPISHNVLKTGQRRGAKIWRRKKNSSQKRRNYERAVAARNKDVCGVAAKQLKSHSAQGTNIRQGGKDGKKGPPDREATDRTLKPKFKQPGRPEETNGRVGAKDGSRVIQERRGSLVGNARQGVGASSISKSPISSSTSGTSNKKQCELQKSRLTKTSEPMKSPLSESVESSRAVKSKVESVPSAAPPTKRVRRSVSPVRSVVPDGVVNSSGKGADRDGCPRASSATGNNSVKSMKVAVPQAAPMDIVEPDDKWWDDDGDDDGGGGGGGSAGDNLVHTTGVQSVAKLSVKNKSTARGSDTRMRDEDGGLPSTNNPKTKPDGPIDLKAEASTAMGILASLLSGDERKRLGREKAASFDEAKGNGESEKQAKKNMRSEAESTRIIEPATPGKLSSKANGEVLDATKVMNTSAEVKADSGGGIPLGEEDHEAKQKRRKVDAPASAQEGKEQASTRLTRKTRGQGHGKGDGGGTDGPLPEHHARPRELSRRAAATPLASTRSAHVLAQGPGSTFSSLGIPPKMVTHLEGSRGEAAGGGMGLSRPTVCQLDAIPVLMKGNNVVIKSETGSGKTLAYLLPLLCDLARMEPKVDRTKGTLAIVLAPTRELSAQILEVLTCVGRPFIWLVPGCISGGERRKSEKARLRKGVTVLVCTPGRLLDHLKMTKCFRRDMLRWLVLDEADRLLDMGFEKQVKEIVELLDQSARAVRAGPAGGSRGEHGELAPSVKVVKRQAVMVSATLNKDVSRLAAALLFKHVRVDADNRVVESIDEAGNALLISGDKRQSKKESTETAKASIQRGARSADGARGGSAATARGEEFSTPRQLVQHYMAVTQKLRLPSLCAFLRARAKEKVVVFMSTCDTVDFHHDLFRRARWPGSRRGSGESLSASQGTEKEKHAGNANEDALSSANIGNIAAQGPGDEFFGQGCRVMRLHGNVPQAERQSTYRAFGAAKTGVLICTDVAARGLDLPTVDWIVQYDPPAEIADYVHRIGRTARKGERGHSLLFLLPKEVGYLEVLEARGLRPKPLSLEGVLCAADAGERDARRADEQLAYELQQGLQLLVGGDKALLDRARAAFQSHVRAYAARAPDSRTVFQVRSLHLGHVARSFALKDPPTALKVGKRVVRRPGVTKPPKSSGETVTNGEKEDPGLKKNLGERVKDSARSLGKRRRDGGGGTGGRVRRLGLTKLTERASRAEFF